MEPLRPGTVVRVKRDARLHGLDLEKGELGVVLMGYWDNSALIHFPGKTDPDLAQHHDDGSGGTARMCRIGRTFSHSDFEVVPKEE